MSWYKIQKTLEAGDTSRVKEIEAEAKAQSCEVLFLYADPPICQFKDKEAGHMYSWLAVTNGSCLRPLILEGEI